MITDLQSESASTMPLSGRADAGVSPQVAESTTAMLARFNLGLPADSCETGLLAPSDEPALDEFVARCLAQLRQVMDGLR